MLMKCFFFPLQNGQLLDSPGSCLQYFSEQPFVTCNEKGVCRLYDDLSSYWLTTDDQATSVGGERPSVDLDEASIISHCRVCRSL